MHRSIRVNGSLLTSELLELFIDGIRHSGRYDLIVIDPDCGAGDGIGRLLP